MTVSLVKLSHRAGDKEKYKWKRRCSVAREENCPLSMVMARNLSRIIMLPTTRPTNPVAFRPHFAWIDNFGRDLIKISNFIYQIVI